MFSVPMHLPILQMGCDTRRVVDSRTCSRKSREQEVGVRQDSFLGSPQGPLRTCGTDFQGRPLVSFGSRYVDQCIVDKEKECLMSTYSDKFACGGLFGQKAEDTTFIV
jgi:hypothetical protein